MVTSAVEKIDDTKVKLSITIDPDEVSSALDQAVTRLSQSVKVPGFRPGKKVPLKVLEGRLGKGAVREEAIREAFPGFYSQALSEHEISPVGPPEFDVDAFEPGAEGAFTATVDVRPEFEVPEFEGMTITHPEWELTDEELHANLDQVRERFAEVETVERPAQKGDFVTVTISGKKADGTEVEEASAEDMLYQVPEEDTDSELDTQLVGASAGDVLEFTDVLGPDYPDGLAGQEISFTAIVKEVKVKTLPELDDEFALTASEFDTIDELMDDLRTQAGAEKRQMAVANLRGAVIEAIAELVEIPLPESLVEEEQRFRLNRLAHQAQHAGLSMDQFLSIAGGDDPQAQTFGDACDQVPADGDGSFVGMSDSPVATAAGNNPLLEQLVGAVGAVNGLGDTLNGAPELTVFAPFNGAFEAIDPEALNGLVEEAQADESGTDSALYVTLAHHVIGANLDADAVVGDQDTLAGDTLTVEGDTDGMTVSDGTVTATVLCGNIPTANATVYVIDSVLAGPIS